MRGSVNTIRILLADTPPMLTAILKDIADAESDLEFMGSVSLTDALEHVLPERGADVLIVSITEADNRALAGSLLMASPGIRVLMLARSGERAVLYELYPVRTEIGDVSPQGVIDAIRRSGPSVH